MDIGALTLGAELADGGEGSIHEVVGQPSVVFKRYHNPADPRIRPEVLPQLIARRGQIKVGGRGVDHWAVWPNEEVTAGGQTVGFLMPRLPSDFYRRIGPKVRPADLSYLAATPVPAWGNVQLPDTSARVRLLSDLAQVLRALHDMGMVYGDISFGNVVWATGPERIIIMDCDGISLSPGHSFLPQKDTIDWDDVAGVAGHPPDQDRDCFKFALAVLRVLTREVSARPSANGSYKFVADLSDTVASAVTPLLNRAAGPVGSRPSAAEWIGALSGRAYVTVTPPKVRPPITGPTPKTHLMYQPNQPHAFQPVKRPKSP